MGITNSGKNELSGLAGNIGTKTAFTYLEVGTGTTAFAATQTTLVTPVTDSGLARASVTPTQTTTTVTNDTLQLSKTWTASGSKTLAEVGVFNAGAAGTMGSRYVLGTTRPVESTFTYTATVKWIFA